MTHVSGVAPFDLESPYPRFSSSEYERRWAELDGLLETEDADVLVVTGHASGRQEIQYLTNAPVRWESFLVLGRGVEARLFVQLYNHVPTMRSWAVTPVEWAGPRPIETVAAYLEAGGLSSGRIALLGPWSERSAGDLRVRLPQAAFLSITRAFAGGRLVKSPEELAWTAYAAGLCDLAVTAFLEAARPGMREDHLAHLLEHGYSHVGGQTGIAFLAVVPAAGGGPVVPSQVPSARRAEVGDVAVFELSAGIGGYTGQVLRTVVLGSEPAAPIKALHEVALASQETIIDAIRPGRAAADLEALGAMIDVAGLTIVDDLVHGYVGGYLPPVLRTPATRHAPPPDLELRPGMCLVVQPNVVSADGRYGIQTGELVTVTEDGVRRLHGAPRDLLHAG